MSIRKSKGMVHGRRVVARIKLTNAQVNALRELGKAKGNWVRVGKRPLTINTIKVLAYERLIETDAEYPFDKRRPTKARIGRWGWMELDNRTDDVQKLLDYYREVGDHWLAKGNTEEFVIWNEKADKLLIMARMERPPNWRAKLEETKPKKAKSFEEAVENLIKANNLREDDANDVRQDMLEELPDGVREKITKAVRDAVLPKMKAPKVISVDEDPVYGIEWPEHLQSRMTLAVTKWSSVLDGTFVGKQVPKGRKEFFACPHVLKVVEEAARTALEEEAPTMGVPHEYEEKAEEVIYQGVDTTYLQDEDDDDEQLYPIFYGTRYNVSADNIRMTGAKLTFTIVVDVSTGRDIRWVDQNKFFFGW